MCECQNCVKSRRHLDILLKIYNEYKWLIDAYVLDFYVNNHWELLPNSWKRDFQHISQSDLAVVVDFTSIMSKSKIICPLSILCLKNLFKHLNIARQSVCVNEDKILLNHEIVTHYERLIQPSIETSKKFNLELGNCLINHAKLKNSFWKFISPKKKHEIIIMSKICSKIAKQCDCSVVLDFGSGLGHLSRILAYGYGLRVYCLEADTTLSQHAKKLDKQFEVTASKHLNEELMKKLIRPAHLNTKIESTGDLDDLVALIRTSLQLTEDFKFGVVGLHPCGDLTAVLLKFFKGNNRNKFINVASCCYMKLSTEINYFCGYPLSTFLLRKKDNNLSYISRELACHAMETYVEKLNNTDCLELKTHAFRATLEKIIVKYWPEKKHCGLKNSKCTEELTFKEYCEKATKNMDLEIPEEDIASEEIKKCLKDWKKVMTFYSLRLMFAPMIESIILIDRLLYIADQDTACSLIPAFDPKWSPRNHLLIATKVVNTFE